MNTSFTIQKLDSLHCNNIIDFAFLDESCRKISCIERLCLPNNDINFVMIYQYMALDRMNKWEGFDRPLCASSNRSMTANWHVFFVNIWSKWHSLHILHFFDPWIQILHSCITFWWCHVFIVILHSLHSFNCQIVNNFWAFYLYFLLLLNVMHEFGFMWNYISIFFLFFGEIQWCWMKSNGLDVSSQWHTFQTIPWKHEMRETSTNTHTTHDLSNDWWSRAKKVKRFG